MQEHIKISYLGNGFVSLVPDKGYRLFNHSTNTYCTEAVVKPRLVKEFEAVPIE